MEKLIIQQTKETPQIEFDGNSGFFSIVGKSYPENVNEFYKPVLEYLELYKQTPALKTTIVFNWLYYNTATTKNIIKIIVRLKDLSNDFEVQWICNKEYELIIEKGKELKEVLEVNLKIIETE